MKPKIKDVSSPDVADLQSYSPEDPASFRILVQLFIGPDGAEGFESFDVVVCTPDWIKQNVARDEILLGRHHAIVQEYDYGRLIQRIEKYLLHCTGDTWEEIAIKVGRLGQWEFEDYSPGGHSGF